jgi:MFS family permease
MAKGSALGAVGYLVGTALGGFVAAGLIERPALGILVSPWSMVIVALLVFSSPATARTSDEPASRSTSLALLRSLRPPDDADYRWPSPAGSASSSGCSSSPSTQLYLMTDLPRLSTQRPGPSSPRGRRSSALARCVASVVTAVVSDRQGRRKPLSVAASLTIAASMVAPAASGPASRRCSCSNVLAGLGYGAFLAVDGALDGRGAPVRRARRRRTSAS